MSTLSKSAWKSLKFDAHPFKALHPGLSPNHSKDGREMRWKAMPGSVLWRAPFPAPGIDASTAGMWGFERDIGMKGFEVRCEVEMDQKGLKQFDQAALFVQLSSTEWIKAGPEYSNGEVVHGVVICNPIGDWSIQPFSSKSRFTISLDPTTATLTVYLGTSMSEDDSMIRQSYSFGLKSAGMSDIVSGQVSSDVHPEVKLADIKVKVGVMVQSPMGEEEGPECIFRNFQMREGVRGKE